MNNELMFSSNKDNWSTPQEFFNTLNDLHLILALMKVIINAVNISLNQIMDLCRTGGGEVVFCNPPYGREIYKWVEKCYWEGHKENTVVVMLIPARTDTKYFHDFILNRSEVRFVKGRLKFGDAKDAAPFPSMIVVFRGAKM